MTLPTASTRSLDTLNSAANLGGDSSEHDSEGKVSTFPEHERVEYQLNEAIQSPLWTTNHRVTVDTARQYAATSHDYNPIHLYPLAGRFAGFPGAIIHGMWSMAWVIGSMCDMPSRSGCTFDPSGSGMLTVKGRRIPTRYFCEFRRPIVLPSEVHLSCATKELRSWNAVPGIDFVVSSGEKPAVVGFMAPIQ